MFKVGQKVVCVKRGRWILSGTNEVNPCGPKYNETVVFDGINDDSDQHIYLREYFVFNQYGFRFSYNIKHFRPLIEYTCSYESGVLESLPGLIETEVERVETEGV